MRLLLLTCLSIAPGISAYGNIAMGCDSRCSVVFDKHSGCFNRSIDFHTQVLFGTMRNYVSAQINLIKIQSNNVPPTRDQLISDTVNVFKTVKPADQSDQDDVLSAEEAQPIVAALVENVMNMEKTTPRGFFWNVFCPEGCEVSHKLFTALTIGSLALNGIFFLLACASVVLNYWKDVKYARKKKGLVPLAEPTSNGHTAH